MKDIDIEEQFTYIDEGDEENTVTQEQFKAFREEAGKILNQFNEEMEWKVLVYDHTDISKKILSKVVGKKIKSYEFLTGAVMREFE